MDIWITHALPGAVGYAVSLLGHREGMRTISCKTACVVCVYGATTDSELALMSIGQQLDYLPENAGANLVD